MKLKAVWQAHRRLKTTGLGIVVAVLSSFSANAANVYMDNIRLEGELVCADAKDDESFGVDMEPRYTRVGRSTC